MNAEVRFRRLNDRNSRFLDLSLKIARSPIKALVGKELSFYPSSHWRSPAITFNASTATSFAAPACRPPAG